MTQEEKAKAYDEALSVARKTHQTQPMYRDWLEKMFPELAESEDEKIRDMIFNCVYQCCDDGFISVEQRNNAISWLEAQGEKPQRIVSAEAKEAMYDKPAPLRTGAIGFDGEPMEAKPCEQKPAWSKEDETKLNDAIDACKAQYGNMSYTADWLLSLKERVQPQPKQEWSDGDEEIIRSLLDIIYECHSYGKCALKLNEYSKLCDWLKSLRPKNTWKPSEKQKEALLWCVVHLGGADKQTLGELLEELNKL